LTSESPTREVLAPAAFAETALPDVPEPRAHEQVEEIDDGPAEDEATPAPAAAAETETATPREDRQEEIDDDPEPEVPTAPAQPRQPKLIESANVLTRAEQEDGPFHQVPAAFEEEILNGTRTQKSEDYVEYSARGSVNGHEGTYEVGVKPSESGENGTVVHRFFRPDKKQ
jgi:hypothetical protein